MVRVVVRVMPSVVQVVLATAPRMTWHVVEVIKVVLVEVVEKSVQLATFLLPLLALDMAKTFSLEGVPSFVCPRSYVVWGQVHLLMAFPTGGIGRIVQ